MIFRGRMIVLASQSAVSSTSPGTLITFYLLGNLAEVWHGVEISQIRGESQK